MGNIPILSILSLYRLVLKSLLCAIVHTSSTWYTAHYTQGAPQVWPRVMLTATHVKSIYISYVSVCLSVPASAAATVRPRTLTIAEPHPDRSEKFIYISYNSHDERTRVIASILWQQGEYTISQLAREWILGLKLTLLWGCGVFSDPTDFQKGAVTTFNGQ